MSDLRKIQQIYEAGYRGNGLDVSINNYPPSSSSGTSSTYPKPVPFSTPDKPAYGVANLVTTPVESEEEVRGNIPRSAVVKLLTAEMENAAAKDMDYCVFVLGKLIQAVKGN
jgi:hypothetical protein